jgi:hypothetical protein
MPNAHKYISKQTSLFYLNQNVLQNNWDLRQYP